MLVEIFARSKPQEKASWHHSGHGSCRLSDNCRVNADNRAGHPCANLQFGCYLSDAAQHTPNKRAVPLLVNPGMKMIGNKRKLEANFFCPARVLDQLIRSMLFR